MRSRSFATEKKRGQRKKENWEQELEVLDLFIEDLGGSQGKSRTQE